MSTRFYLLGGTRSRSVSRDRGHSGFGVPAWRRVRSEQALVWALLATGCGGKPDLVYGSDGGPTTAGATSYYAQPNGGGSALDFKGGSAGTSAIEEPSVCGNGKLERRELCDDGNANNGDGCAADCTQQDPHYDCSHPGQPCGKWVVCGNGTIEGDELCDDANTLAGDGCAANCSAVEPGFACAKPGKPCVALPKCGNGIRERGEGCDDGEAIPDSGDGCSATCQLEVGFVCQIPGQPCVKEVCGDGQRTPTEKCDDKNAISGDGCSERCEIETGWRCTAVGCSPVCGDGLSVKDEECDDGNRMTGDGCSASCRKEPFFTCAGQPSVCRSSIACGNNVREPGEICDPPGKDGCSSGCKTFLADVIDSVTECGNLLIERGETCDPPAVGSGCSAECTAEPGWSCPRPGPCNPLPRCGDGVVNGTEVCDDGNDAAGDGCAACGVEANWSCYGLGPSKCVPEICGDGILSPKELCDDKNAASGDGCSSCTIDPGWVCPIAGTACRARCGDGKISGQEKCDDGNVKNGDGCNSGCRIEPGFDCPVGNKPCVASACPNGKKEAGESCDDGNRIAGDGCSPTCQLEPRIEPGSSPRVLLVCGDGLLTEEEECDDGNTDSEDGCSKECKKEAGFSCTSELKLPNSVDFQVTYRDFKAGNARSPGGHPDFQYSHLTHVADITGAPCTTTNAATCGRLDVNGKPVLQLLNSRSTTGILNAQTFSLFFRDTNSSGITGQNGAIVMTPFKRTLTLRQSATGSDVYTFDAKSAFFPLGPNEGYGAVGQEVGLCNNGAGVPSLSGSPACDTGCDATCQGRNFHFTTELRYFFQYRGDEMLTFRGDDDVWVYINGRLAVDIGGVHREEYGRVVLGDDGSPSGADSDCSAHSVAELKAIGSCYTDAEKADARDERFDLTRGKVYEIVLFHAERHTNQSNFLLTLSGFLAPRSHCDSICGDGIVVAGEVCDDGANNRDGVSGVCNTTCTSLAFCGDGVVQTGETCDNGKNTDLYVSAPNPSACAPGCVLPPTCGDGKVQGAEQCDNGLANNDAGYGPNSCTKACKFGGYCGDGVVNGTELCDAGSKNGDSYGPGSCGYDCKSGPYYCGDGVRNGSEECDEGPTGGATCDKDCKVVPYCGDGFVSPGESCDWGQFASTAYGSCTSTCLWSSRCGDKVVDAPREECDDGVDKNLGTYGGCTVTCNLGPRCGDGTTQPDQGEKCDNGLNDDAYEYASGACGPNCQRPPYCGDGNLMPGYELCDAGVNNSDTAYEGCTTHCEWGPYCGDGKVDPQGGEVCDSGRDNLLYGRDSSGCGVDCKPAPYCGDGERNGPEQCDLGTALNTGAYGTCNADCTLSPRCGDYKQQANEECDEGPTGGLNCTSMCHSRSTIL